MPVGAKAEKSRINVFVLWFVALEVPKVGLLKHRVRRHLARCDERCKIVLWREANLAKESWCSEHSWKLGCLKSARKSDANHVWKSMRAKNTSVGAHLVVPLLNKSRCCGAKHVWKWTCLKHCRFGALLSLVQEVHAICGAMNIWKSTCASTPHSEHFWKVGWLKKLTAL